MAGWGSNNKYALLSAMRAVNQIISYDLPFILSALVPVLLAGSLQLSDIAAAQARPLVHLLSGHRPARLRRLHHRRRRRGEPRAVRHPRGGVGAGRRLPRRVLGDEVRAHPARRVRARDRHVVPRRAAVPRRLGRARARRGSGRSGSCSRRCSCSCCITWIRWSFVRIRVDQILRVSWKLLLPATLLLLIATAAIVVWRTPHA